MSLVSMTAPRLGDIAMAADVGIGMERRKVVWLACVDCGKERWVYLKSGRPQNERCHSCGVIRSGESRRGERNRLPVDSHGGIPSALQQNGSACIYMLGRIRLATNGCWHWHGPLNPDGYGMWRGAMYRGQLAHRAVYGKLVGPVIAGLELDHLCHNVDLDCVGGAICAHRRCVNPEHLEPVTHAVNSVRGQGFAAKNLRKTHCKRGHEFTEANTRSLRGGNRRCRQCERDYDLCRGKGSRPKPQPEGEL